MNDSRNKTSPRRGGFTIAILCLLTAGLCLLAGCGEAESPAPTPEETPAQAAAEQEAQNAEAAPKEIVMTDSYREARQAYFDVTGIWMPEAEGFEAEYDVNYEQKSNCFDSHGDRALYEAARSALIGALGAPDQDDGINCVWNVPGETEGKVVMYDLYYDDYYPEDPWVYMNVH